MTHIASRGKEDVPYCFSRSSVTFQCHTGQKVGFGSNLGKLTRPFAAIKFLGFALFIINKIWKYIIEYFYTAVAEVFIDFATNICLFGDLSWLKHEMATGRFCEKQAC